MKKWIDKLFGWVPQAFRTPVAFFVVLVLLVGLWFYGVRAWNGVGNWFYHHSENSAKQEIQGIKTQLVDETKLANQAVAAYEASKAVIAEEKKKRELAESILADKTKNTDQKLAAYEKAVTSRPVVTGPESDDELCQRAKSLGLSVQCN